MDDNKITFLKEKEISKRVSKNSQIDVVEYAQNPIAAKFKAFKNAKKNISFKDLI